MTEAFCPGHITCFFHPVRTDDPVTTGSRGAGLRLSSGTTVVLEERTDGDVVISMDGVPSEAPISRLVLSSICPGRGFDVSFSNDLPVGQGFGMSASGAIALAMAACSFAGIPLEEAYMKAHIAEVMGGGGLGDVSAIACNGHQPVRLKPGLPPHGRVEDTGVVLDRLTLIVLGDKLSTGPIIADPDMQNRMTRIAGDMIESYFSNPSAESLFGYSRRFSSSMGLESDAVRRALDLLGRHGPAGMCMLGHSIFTTLSPDEVSEVLGDVEMYGSSTSDAPAFIRKA